VFSLIHTHGEERHRPRQPLHRRGARRGRHRRRPHPDLPRRQVLLSDPDAACEDLGTDYYERRQDIRRRARNHVRSLERLGYMVTIESLSPDPETGELPITQAS